MHAQGQLILPEEGWIYGDESLPRIDLSMDPADLERLYADKLSDTEYPAVFSFTREGSTAQLSEVGVRFRGNTSRYKEKMSFRLSFNSFDHGGREFYGLEKLNLNAETNDPSMIRSKLTWHLFRRLGVPASRSNHALLYINGDFYGVYINTEHVDENFARSRFGENHGNLYKCLWPADLAYRGQHQVNYKHENNGERVYGLRINEQWDDYADLAAFITAMEKNSSETLPEVLEAIFNVQQYLKAMAVDVMSANWDGYIGNKNNYYLYRDPVGERIHYIPYDLDNTWGIDYLGVDWARHPIYEWNREWRPLYEKLLEIPVYRAVYSAWIRELIDYLGSAELRAEVERWQSQIAPWVQTDPWYPLDNGFSYEDFQASLDEAWNQGWDQVKYGVFEYAGLRSATALEEVSQEPAGAVVTAFRARAQLSGVEVEWTCSELDLPESSVLYYSFDRGPWQSIAAQPYFTDAISGARHYREMVPVTVEKTRVELYIETGDGSQVWGSMPPEPFSVDYPLGARKLCINEFLASNVSGKQDQDGDFDDWLEVYNLSGENIWMGDKFLSDDRGRPGRYRFPAMTLEPGGFLLIWCDGQEQDPGDPTKYEWHAPFRLDADGEHIRLSDAPSLGFAVYDSLSYDPQNSDVSFGRITDGDPLWTFFAAPTPNYSNLSTGLDHRIVDQLSGRLVAELKAWPNPVAEGPLHFNRVISGEVYDLNGRKVMEVDRSDHLDPGLLGPGLYLLRTGGGELLRFLVLN